ncbi:MAG TPA: formate/nitrite transporter family protein, partial [Aggregatilineales bacterium]|nr:formate/nitrite transporter family protein [Aggregatilineales bacterium]
KSKANLDTASLLVLAVLAGAFISLGAIFATTVSTGVVGVMPIGIGRLISGLVFCLGLILVLVGGAELFTGNNLIVMAWAGGKVSTPALLRNWGIVYVGNFAGSIATAALMFLTKQYLSGSGAVGETAVTIANNKMQFGFAQAVALGIMCNALVCLAIWLTYSARTTIDKIAAIIFPITAFVTAGFEHSIANMYFVPVALFIKQFDADYVKSLNLDLSRLTWDSFFLHNLLPVTIGNIIGGSVMVAAVYWFIYLRPGNNS